METTLEQEDLDANAEIFHRQPSAPLLQRFSAEANKDLLSPEEYRTLMRGLNTKQRKVVAFHRRWCKKAVISVKNGEAVKPYRVFLSGPGGVGKKEPCDQNDPHGHGKDPAALRTSATRRHHSAFNGSYWSCGLQHRGNDSALRTATWHFQAKTRPSCPTFSS